MPTSKSARLRRGVENVRNRATIVDKMFSRMAVEIESGGDARTERRVGRPARRKVRTRHNELDGTYRAAAERYACRCDCDHASGLAFRAAKNADRSERDEIRREAKNDSHAGGEAKPDRAAKPPVRRGHRKCDPIVLVEDGQQPKHPADVDGHHRICDHEHTNQNTTTFPSHVAHP